MSDYKKMKKTLDEIGIIYKEDPGELMNGTTVLNIVIDINSSEPYYDEEGNPLVPCVVFDDRERFMRFETVGA